MIFELVKDFAAVLEAMPAEHPRRRILKLLDEAVRRDIHFIHRHPTTLFQCMWNTCWWYDCPEAAKHYEEPEGGWKQPPPWEKSGQKLYEIVKRWREEKEEATPGFAWLRALRPPSVHLGSAQRAVLGAPSGFHCVAFSPDGTRIAAGSWAVVVWEAASGRELTNLHCHDHTSSVDFSPDGKQIVSGSHDATVRVWDADTGMELAVLRGHQDQVTSVAFSPDGTRIASGCAGWVYGDKSVRLWDAESGLELAALRGHEENVTSIAFSPDGTRIASGSYDQTVRVWDPQTAECLAILRGHESRVFSVAFSPVGTRIASGSEDDTVRIWNAETGAELAVLRGHEGPVTSIAFSPDGTRIASGSSDKTVRVWDSKSGQELELFTDRLHDVTSVAFSPEGILIASASYGGVRVWGLKSGRVLLVLQGHDKTITSVSFSPDGTRVVSGSEDNTVRVWDAESGAELACLKGHESGVWSVAFLPDGRRIASASADRTVRVWDAASGAELSCLKGHDGPVYDVAFSPDGRRIVSGSEDNTVRVWDAVSGRELTALRGHERPVVDVAFSPDGTRIVSASDDCKFVRVWDAQEFECLEVIRGMWRARAIAASLARLPLSMLAHALSWVAESAESSSPLPSFPEEYRYALGILQASQVPVGAEGFRLRESIPDDGLAVESASTGSPVAWFADQLDRIAIHPSGRAWAGGVAGHLCLILLEGALDAWSKKDSMVTPDANEP